MNVRRDTVPDIPDERAGFATGIVVGRTCTCTAHDAVQTATANSGR
jgi:hypothetical protein